MRTPLVIAFLVASSRLAEDKPAAWLGVSMSIEGSVPEADRLRVGGSPRNEGLNEGLERTERRP